MKFTKRKLNGKFAKKDQKVQLLLLAGIMACVMVFTVVQGYWVIKLSKELTRATSYTPVAYTEIFTQTQELEAYAREQAELLGVDPDKFITLIGCESSWNPKAEN